jgi:hypothetical protein
MYLLPICILSFESCLLNSFSYLLIGLWCFLCLIFGALYYCQYWVLNSGPCTCGYMLTAWAIPPALFDLLIFCFYAWDILDWSSQYVSHVAGMAGRYHYPLCPSFYGLRWVVTHCLPWLPQIIILLISASWVARNPVGRDHIHLCVLYIFWI